MLNVKYNKNVKYSSVNIMVSISYLVTVNEVTLARGESGTYIHIPPLFLYWMV